MKNNKQFSTILKDCREHKKLNKTQLGNKSGIKPSAISNFESGYRKPSVDSLIKLADVFEVTTDYLLGREVIEDASDSIVKYSKKLTTQDRMHVIEFMKRRANKNY